MGQLEDLQAKGFGSHGGQQYIVKDREIYPLGKRVLVSDMRFGDKKTKGGIILLDDDGKESGIHPRWCKAFAIGPKQEDVTIGQWLLVAHGRWSRAITVVRNKIKYEVRMIDENDILLISDDEPSDADVNLKAGYINTGSYKQMTKMPGND